MPQPFTKSQDTTLRIDRVCGSQDVLARITPSMDTTSRRSDLRRLAERYNALFRKRSESLRIAQ
ncbi:MAG: hypothetical protein ACIAQF_02020 [Phycisphaerales bacterium JB065]